MVQLSLKEHHIEYKTTNIALLIHTFKEKNEEAPHVIDDKIIVIQIHGPYTLCLKTPLENYF